MAMLTVDGHPISKDPASMEVTYNPVNASDAGRDQGGTMHVNRIGVKRKIALSWAIPHEAQAAEILRAFAPEYFSVTYFDPMDRAMETRRFYCGTPTVPFRSYRVPCVGGTTFSQISLDIIEV